MSDEPLRLLDDPGTPALLRDDLERERSAPWEHDAVAGLAALQAAIRSGGPLPPGDGPGGGSGAPDAGPVNIGGPPPGVVAAAAKGGIAAKGLLLGLAAVGVAAGLAIAVGRGSTSSTPPPPAELTAPVVTETPSTTDLTPPALPSTTSLSVPAEGVDTSSKAAPATSLKGGVKSAASASREQRNAEEIAHMITLREKADSDPAGALRLAEEGQQKYAGGLFSLEREFIAIQSLARLGRTAEARSRGERLIAAHPTSPYADRVRAAIGQSPQPSSP